MKQFIAYKEAERNFCTKSITLKQWWIQKSFTEGAQLKFIQN